MAKDGGAADPLRNPRFQEPSVWQLFRESLFGKPRLLDCIQVEVTSVCPGRCVYCPHTTQAGYWRSRHMEAATFARLWPLMQESGRVHLQGWGEPFLHPRFMDFAALARKAGCRVSTTTCGLRMDETLAGQIVGSGIDIVAFSLVGTDEASNAPRAGVPFSRVREAVRTLQRVRKPNLGRPARSYGRTGRTRGGDQHAGLHRGAGAGGGSLFPARGRETGRRPGHTRTRLRRNRQTRARPLLQPALPSAR